MKSLKSMLMGLAVTGVFVFLPAVSFADSDKGQDKADIKLARDSAQALEASRPDLAKALNNYADREEQELNAEIKGNKEKEEVGEKGEPKEEAGEKTENKIKQ